MKVDAAIYLPLEGDGDVRFSDGHAFKFRTRIAHDGRRVRLLSTILEIGVNSPTRKRALEAWLDEHHPTLSGPRCFSRGARS